MIRFILLLIVAIMSSCTYNTYTTASDADTTQDSILSDTIEYEVGNTNMQVFGYVCDPDNYLITIPLGMLDEVPHHLTDRAVAYINAEYVDTMVVSNPSMIINWMQTELNASCNDMAIVLDNLNTTAHSSSYILDKTGVMRHLTIDLIVRSQCADAYCESLIDTYYL